MDEPPTTGRPWRVLPGGGFCPLRRPIVARRPTGRDDPFERKVKVNPKSTRTYV